MLAIGSVFPKRDILILHLYMRHSDGDQYILLFVPSMKRVSLYYTGHPYWETQYVLSAMATLLRCESNDYVSTKPFFDLPLFFPPFFCLLVPYNSSTDRPGLLSCPWRISLLLVQRCQGHCLHTMTREVLPVTSGSSHFLMQHRTTIYRIFTIGKSGNKSRGNVALCKLFDVALKYCLILNTYYSSSFVEWYM